MLCKMCGFVDAGDDDLCRDCRREWDADIAEITRLIKEGHTHHCACRQVWGDGECTCEMEKYYDPYWWIG